MSTQKAKVAKFCQEEAQYIADKYGRGHPLWAYYQSWADIFAELATGVYRDPGSPFAASREIGELPHGRDFCEAWAKEISGGGNTLKRLSGAKTARKGLKTAREAPKTAQKP